MLSKPDEDYYGFMADENTGDNKTVEQIDFAELSGEDAYNYVLDKKLSGVTVNISKADWNVEKIEEYVTPGEAVADADISTFLAPGGSYGTISVIQGEDQFETAPVINVDKLSFKMKSELDITDVIFEIPVTGATNYKDYVLTVTLKVPHKCVPVKVDTISADCINEGFMEHYECEICGKLYKDEKATEPVTAEELLIPALGHDWDEGVIVLRPTKTTDGIRRHSCRRCSETEDETVPAGTVTHSALDPVPEDLDSCTELYLVKGQKFTIGKGWSVSADIAFVDEDGHIVARAAGKAKLTAKVNGKTITVNVTVK